MSLAGQFIIIFVSLLFGVAFSALYFWQLLKRRQEEAYEKGKAEMEEAKSELSDELQQELESIRERLMDSLLAYDKASKAVEVKLAPTNAKKLDAPKNYDYKKSSYFDDSNAKPAQTSCQKLFSEQTKDKEEAETTNTDQWAAR